MHLQYIKSTAQCRYIQCVVLHTAFHHQSPLYIVDLIPRMLWVSMHYRNKVSYWIGVELQSSPLYLHLIYHRCRCAGQCFVYPKMRKIRYRSYIIWVRQLQTILMHLTCQPFLIWVSYLMQIFDAIPCANVNLTIGCKLTLTQMYSVNDPGGGSSRFATVITSFLHHVSQPDKSSYSSHSRRIDHSVKTPVLHDRSYLRHRSICDCSVSL